jgi:hypothetical protein
MIQIECMIKKVSTTNNQKIVGFFWIAATKIATELRLPKTDSALRSFAVFIDGIFSAMTAPAHQ